MRHRPQAYRRPSRILRFTSSGGVYLPATITGLALAIEPSPSTSFTDAGGTIQAGDGGAVYVQKDRVSAGITFSQSVAGSRPTLKLVGTKWALRFDGGDELSRGSRVLSSDNNWTIAAAWTNSSVAAEQSIFLNGTTGDNNGFCISPRTTSGSIGGLYPGVAWLETATAAATGTNWRQLWQRSAGTATTRINAAAIAISNGTATPNASGNNAYIGSAAGLKFFSGDLYGLYAYSRILTAAEIAVLESYLSTLF